MSAVATFGRTNEDDGTGGEQPWGTVISYNKVHELGAFQLQSSAWFTSKACLTRAEGNVLFNGPRAMININDGEAGCTRPQFSAYSHLDVTCRIGFGGGNNITSNSIFNTCRQSGDHGSLDDAKSSSDVRLHQQHASKSPHCRSDQQLGPDALPDPYRFGRRCSIVFASTDRHGAQRHHCELRGIAGLRQRRREQCVERAWGMVLL